MRERLLRLAIPAYLLLCLLLGGSVQGVWRVMSLQLLAIALIAWAALAPKGEPLSRAARLVLLLAIFTLLLFVLQLVPLPPEIWTALPGREAIADGYAKLGYELPWLPLSLSAYDTLATSLTLLPPLAVLAAMLKLRAYEESWLAGALILGTLIGVLLGAMQSLGGSASGDWWRLYERTNSGAVGLFANRNHMGTLLLVSIPFAVALIASGRGGRGKIHGLLVAGIGGLLVVLVGLALNLSSAAIALSVPVIVFSALILAGDRRKQRLIFAAAALLTVLAVVLYTSSPIQSELAGEDTASLETRRTIWALSWSAQSDGFPGGFGLGSFEQVYRLYEGPQGIGRTYVNHAHNDFLQILLEAGLAGLLLLGAFLSWWALRVVHVWRSPLSSHFARAATIASGAILAHSIVDYPLRTAAIAALFAACIAIMAQPWRQRHSGETGEPRPTRHLAIG